MFCFNDFVLCIITYVCVRLSLFIYICVFLFSYLLHIDIIYIYIYYVFMQPEAKQHESRLCVVFFKFHWFRKHRMLPAGFYHDFSQSFGEVKMRT